SVRQLQVTGVGERAWTGGMAWLRVAAVAGSKPRRLVLCLDGTWNSAYSLKRRSDGHAVFKPSNVLKVARAVVPYDAAGDRQQIVLYHIGVGSLARYPGVSNRLLSVADKVLGGGWGAGFEENVEEALEFLAHNHEPGDEVFVFGFSRGAATAQAVTRFLDWAGGLPLKHDSYYLPRLFHDYVSRRGAEPVAAARTRRARAAASTSASSRRAASGTLARRSRSTRFATTSARRSGEAPLARTRRSSSGGSPECTRTSAEAMSTTGSPTSRSAGC